ncbi:MAG: F0F1 ATP synthase subunit alpha, partial [Paracoccaceae bacterium]
MTSDPAQRAALILRTGLDRARRAARRTRPSIGLAEIGRISALGDGVAQVSGLATAMADELLELGDGGLGLVGDLEPDRLGVILLDPAPELAGGDPVRRTGRVAETPTGPALLGRIVDPLGRPLDRRGAVGARRPPPIEHDAQPVQHRAPVRPPVQTALNANDPAEPN